MIPHELCLTIYIFVFINGRSNSPSQTFINIRFLGQFFQDFNPFWVKCNFFF